MTVPMVNVWNVWMAVGLGFVAVRMDMRLAPIPIAVMRVPMVFVMDMLMRMGDRIVRMEVHMALGQMQPDSRPHQQARYPEPCPRRIAQHG